jgi:hypothetical protein
MNYASQRSYQWQRDSQVSEETIIRYCAQPMSHSAQCRKPNLRRKWTRLGCNEGPPTSSFCGISLLIQSMKRREQRRLRRELGAGAEAFIESLGLKNDKAGADKPSVRPLQSPEAEPPVGMVVDPNEWPSPISFALPLQKQNPESFSSVFISGARYGS